jgi:acyl-CoA synthetase (AMP-forming)/AMP-acid ligase II
MLFQTRSNTTCSRSGTTTAAAHRMTQTYRITAASSVQAKGLLKKNRAVIWITNTMNRVRKSPPPITLAAFWGQLFMGVVVVLAAGLTWSR